jgi:high-affinity Fe2+/Pb2+ permease
MRERRGCLEGLLQMFLLTAAFDWLEKRFGFGRRKSCTGCGCGLVILIVFVVLALQILTTTDWFHPLALFP